MNEIVLVSNDNTTISTLTFYIQHLPVRRSVYAPTPCNGVEVVDECITSFSILILTSLVWSVCVVNRNGIMKNFTE